MKIKKVIFFNHPIFKDREFHFENENGDAYDTIVLAGENGAGKSSLLRFLNDMELLFSTNLPGNPDQYQIDTYEFYEKTKISIVFSYRNYKSVTLTSTPIIYGYYTQGNQSAKRTVTASFKSYADDVN